MHGIADLPSPDSCRAPAAGVRGMTVALIAPSLEILGGHAIQVRALARGLRSEGCDVLFVPINPSFPPGLRWLGRVRYVRTAVNEALYMPPLLRLRQTTVVNTSSPSAWAFVMSPLPPFLPA